jgi:hypothetical protein
MESLPEDVQDYLREGQNIICEEFVYSIGLITYMPTFWYNSVRDLGFWIL